MPKIVDREERRHQIADAVFDLIQDGGIEEASLRNVADRAGLNVGSVRHYVDGHEGMLIDAVRVMGERVEARIQERFQAFVAGDQQDPATLVVDLLEQLLPLDDRTRREVAVWLAFTELSRTQPRFADEAKVLLRGSRSLARPLLENAGAADVDRGVELLAGLIDGLALALLHDPSRFTRSQVRELILTQVQLCLTLEAGEGSGHDEA